jgi:hypothetical protein
VPIASVITPGLRYWRWMLSNCFRRQSRYNVIGNVDELSAGYGFDVRSQNTYGVVHNPTAVTLLRSNRRTLYGFPYWHILD